MQKTNKKSSDFPQVYLAAATSDDDDDDHHHHHDNDNDFASHRKLVCWQKMKMAKEKKDERDRSSCHMDLDGGDEEINGGGSDQFFFSAP